MLRIFCNKNLVIAGDGIHDTTELSPKFVANCFVAVRDRNIDYFSHGVERNVFYAKAPDKVFDMCDILLMRFGIK